MPKTFTVDSRYLEFKGTEIFPDIRISTYQISELRKK